MSNLQHRQDKIKTRRMKTDFRDFVMEIASWFPMNLYKNNGMITPYSGDIDRISGILSPKDFDEIRNDYIIENRGNFIKSISEGLRNSKPAGLKVIGNNENSEYNYIILGAKNSYLSIVVVDSEEILYTYNSFSCQNIYNCILVQKSNNIAYSRIISNSSKIFYSSNIENSNNIRFSSNLIGCNECICCDNLSNQEFCINNQKYEKTDYLKQKEIIINNKNEFINKYNKALDNKGLNIGENIEGSFNKLCYDVKGGFMNYQLKNGKNVVFCNATDILENAVDCCSIGGLKSDNICGCMGVGYGCSHVYCSVECSPSCNFVYYSYLLDSCSFCLGCIGLKNKSYCILNKQYSKEERYKKVDEIFGQMDKDGTLGDFFPASMNPFYFNDTAAYLIDPSFTKKEVTAKGYLRRDEPIKVDIPERMEIVESKDLGKYESFDKDGNRTIDPIILKKTIRDDEGNVYRVIKLEYDFLMKYGLPLPRKHRLTRMKENFRIN